MKKSTEISINGCIDVSDNYISHDEFADLFIQWVESNNWYFGGGICEYKDDFETPKPQNTD